MGGAKLLTRSKENPHQKMVFDGTHHVRMPNHSSLIGTTGMTWLFDAKFFSEFNGYFLSKIEVSSGSWACFWASKTGTDIVLSLQRQSLNAYIGIKFTANTDVFGNYLIVWQKTGTLLNDFKIYKNKVNTAYSEVYNVNYNSSFALANASFEQYIGAYQQPSGVATQKTKFELFNFRQYPRAWTSLEINNYIDDNVSPSDYAINILPKTNMSDQAVISNGSSGNGILVGLNNTFYQNI